MLLIDCPWCGPRSEREFRCGGEGHIVRPERPDATDDAAWADYLFYRHNRKGIGHERWHHKFGCGRWFNVARDTTDHRVATVYGMNDPKPGTENSR